MHADTHDALCDALGVEHYYAADEIIDTARMMRYAMHKAQAERDEAKRVLAAVQADANIVHEQRNYWRDQATLRDSQIEALRTDLRIAAHHVKIAAQSLGVFL